MNVRGQHRLERRYVNLNRRATGQALGELFDGELVPAGRERVAVV